MYIREDFFVSVVEDTGHADLIFKSNLSKLLCYVWFRNTPRHPLKSESRSSLTCRSYEKKNYDVCKTN